jgi:hypothetical protein
MRRLAIAGVCGLAVLAASASHAQTPEPGSRAACEARFVEWIRAELAGARPFAALWEHKSIGYDCLMVAFYAVNLPDHANPDRKPVYLARRWYSGYDGIGAVRHADSRSCEDMGWAMWNLSRFEFPAISVPGLAPRRSVMEMTVDGSDFGFWTNRLQNGEGKLDTTVLAFSGSNNDALRDLSKKALGPIARCWQEAAPTAP